MRTSVMLISASKSLFNLRNSNLDEAEKNTKDQWSYLNIQINENNCE